MLKKVLVALVVLAVFMPGSASAHLQTQGDGDDVDGKLDMRELLVNHDEHSVFVTVRTYEPFGPTVLEHNRFALTLKRQGSQVPWYYLEIRHNNGAYRARLVPCNDEACKYKAGDLVPVSRPDGRSIRARIPRSSITKAGSVLRWSVQSGDGNYVDRAPDSGVLIQDTGAAG